MRSKGNNSDLVVRKIGGKRGSLYQNFPTETMPAFTGINLILNNIASFPLLPVLTAPSEG